jgi:hypothetical protein
LVSNSLSKKNNHQTESFWEFNVLALNWCLFAARIKLDWSFKEKYIDSYPDSVIDFMNIHRNRLNGVVKFEPYFRVFGNTYFPNVSFLEVLFNLAPETSSYMFKQTAI